MGRGHEDYVASLYNLGNAYEDIKEYDKAIELHNKALLKGQRLNTVSKMDLADILTSLGRSYEKQGNYKKAEKVLKRFYHKGLTSDKKNARITFVRRNGGIGRRARFRSVW